MSFKDTLKVFAHLFGETLMLTIRQQTGPNSAKAARLIAFGV